MKINYAMYAYLHTHTHNTYAHMHAHTRQYTHTRTHARTHTHTHTHTHKHTCTRTMTKIIFFISIGLSMLATCPNVVVKVSGLWMFGSAEKSQTLSEFADVARTVVSVFGVHRYMFVYSICSKLYIVYRGCVVLLENSHFSHPLPVLQ